MTSITNYIIVDDFIIHSVNCNEFITYLISLDLHKHFAQHLIISEDSRFVEIESLCVIIHNGIYKSIEYRATSGRGYKMPRITYTPSDV
ncbi:ACH96149.1 Ac146-like protein [Kallithea virus]|uniref:ACH96149.1 Ac146-like protein n=1 Tax=Kallithea virus TaxID=1654582 RepID=A0A1S5VFZ6_9VIRU|nr:ACH96149.1 Ac146-like protein [Kallithea virus]AQN78571.1 ACH96149.1 Ac146-like protein [Kallithea virus]